MKKNYESPKYSLTDSQMLHAQKSYPELSLELITKILLSSAQQVHELENLDVNKRSSNEYADLQIIVYLFANNARALHALRLDNAKHQHSVMFPFNDNRKLFCRTIGSSTLISSLFSDFSHQCRDSCIVKTFKHSKNSNKIRVYSSFNFVWRFSAATNILWIQQSLRVPASPIA